jgi:beta-glucosidase
LGLIAARAAAVTYQYPFQNPDLPVEDRIDNLISLMTLDEKIACLGTNPSVPRLGVRGTNHIEGLHGAQLSLLGRQRFANQPRGNAAGFGGEIPGSAAGGAATTQAATRPGGRAGGRGRFRSVTTTTFPQEIGMGETWDVDVIHQAGAIEGNEMRYAFVKYQRGGLVLRAPNADLGRDPRWGRTEECFGEDPFFNGSLVVAFVKGVQGDDPRYLQAASLMKHFLANSNEDTRTRSSSDFDERLFQEYYSVPFRMGVMEGNAQAFMAAYNKVNGIPCTVQPFLRSIRAQWNFNGIICTDGGAVGLLVTDHKYFPDVAQAAAATIRASVGQFLDRATSSVHRAVDEKLLTEADINEVLKNTFRVMIRLGMLDPPAMVPYNTIARSDPWLTDDHKAVAKLVTLKSIVLLKNSGNLLPLDRQAVKSIAVIGPLANEVLYDWYSGQPPYAINPLQGIRAKAGPGVRVDYAADNQNDAAAALAKSADVAVVCVGSDPLCGAAWAKTVSTSEGKESVDRKTINLDDEDLVRQVYAANPRTIVVLISSFPYAINWTERNIPAIIHMTHCSQEEGSALADVLFGDYNPAGRLVQTWPKSLDQVPPLMDYDIRHGRTYMYFNGEPLYPFGFGLSYTSFEYSNLRTSAEVLSPDWPVTVSVDVKNAGARDGEEVVQLYISHLNSAVERPREELKGFQRVAIKAGETRTVTMTLPASRLAYWNTRTHDWTIEGDRVKLMVGASSADIRADKTIVVTP